MRLCLHGYVVAGAFYDKQERKIIMKNTLTDLNNHLFAQMERLSKDSL